MDISICWHICRDSTLPIIGAKYAKNHSTIKSAIDVPEHVAFVTVTRMTARKTTPSYATIVVGSVTTQNVLLSTRNLGRTASPTVRSSLSVSCAGCLYRCSAERTPTPSLFKVEIICKSCDEVVPQDSHFCYLKPWSMNPFSKFRLVTFTSIMRHGTNQRMAIPPTRGLPSTPMERKSGFLKILNHWRIIKKQWKTLVSSCS